MKWSTHSESTMIRTHSDRRARGASDQAAGRTRKREHEALRSALIVAACLMGGCGAETDNSGESAYGDQRFESTLDMGAQGGASAGAQAGEDTGGSSERFEAPEVWARQNIMVGLAELPAFGIVLSETRTTLRTTITNTDGVLISREETCKIEIDRPDASEVATTIPQAFSDSIALFDRALTMEGDALQFAQVVQVQGAYLKDPASDELPTTTDDPRVFDQDQDGQPGLTVLISGLLEGNLQVIQRLTTRLSGEIDGDQMEGILTWKTEEHVISGSNPILARDVPLAVHPEYPSYFVARRVSSEMTCAEILAESDSIFWRSELDQRPE